MTGLEKNIDRFEKNIGTMTTEIDKVFAEMERLKKENERLKIYEDKTQLARNYNIIKKENEELKKKADAETTIQMIDKLNEEFEEVQFAKNELEKENKKQQKEINKLEEERFYWDGDLREGNVCVSINSSWMLEWLNEAYLQNPDNTYKWNTETYGDEDSAKRQFLYRMSGVLECELNKRTLLDESITYIVSEELNNGDEIEEVEYSSDEDEDEE